MNKEIKHSYWFFVVALLILQYSTVIKRDARNVHIWWTYKPNISTAVDGSLFRQVSCFKSEVDNIDVKDISLLVFLVASITVLVD